MPGRKQASVWAQIGFYTTLGFTVPATALAGLVLGGWLDRELKTGPFLMVLLGMLGGAAGLIEVLRLLSRAEKRAGRNNSSDESGSS